MKIKNNPEAVICKSSLPLPPSSDPVWSVRPEQVALRYVIGPATHRESRQLTHTQHDCTGIMLVSIPRRLCRTISRKGASRSSNTPPYSPDLAPADSFLFPTLKKELAGITLAPGDFIKEWGRLLKTISKEDFAKAFVRWQERCKKCIRIGGSYVEKS